MDRRRPFWNSGARSSQSHSFLSLNEQTCPGDVSGPLRIAHHSLPVAPDSIVPLSYRNRHGISRWMGV